MPSLLSSQVDIIIQPYLFVISDICFPPLPVLVLQMCSSSLMLKYFHGKIRFFILFPFIIFKGYFPFVIFIIIFVILLPLF